MSEAELNLIAAIKFYNREFDPVVIANRIVDDMDDVCVTCAAGFYLPSGYCDHCNTRRPE